MRSVFVCVPIAFVAVFAGCMSLRANRQIAPIHPTTTPMIIVRVLGPSGKHAVVESPARQIQRNSHLSQPTVTPLPPRPVDAAPVEPANPPISTDPAEMERSTAAQGATASATTAAPIVNVAVASIDEISTALVPEAPPAPTPDVVPIELPIVPSDPSLIAQIASNASVNETGSVWIDDLRARLLALHNHARLEVGLAPYQASYQLQQAAQYQANFLASRPAAELMRMGIAGHIGPNGERPSARALRFGYSSDHVSENWAYFDNAQAAFDFWLTDPWHRPQVLSTELIEVGFGISTQPEFGTIFVAVYGRP